MFKIDIIFLISHVYLFILNLSDGSIYEKFYNFYKNSSYYITVVSFILCLLVSENV